MDRETCYLAYLLRLWQQGGGEGSQWRASLESPQSGGRRAFANLAELFAFLESETGSRSLSIDLPKAKGPRLQAWE